MSYKHCMEQHRPNRDQPEQSPCHVPGALPDVLRTRPRSPRGPDDERPADAPGVDPALLEPGTGRALRCVECRHAITSVDARIEKGGSHRNVFCNPHGVVFEVGCFAVAPGCVLVGGVSTEFSWFPGHAWRVAVCGRCHLHLGWRFQNTEGTGAFFGLILPHLVEEHDPQGPDA
jgi:hypothetical protein